MLSRFYLIPERNGQTNRQTDRQTDRQTNRFAISISRVSMLTRDKNGYLKCRYDTDTEISISVIYQRYFWYIDPPLIVIIPYSRWVDNSIYRRYIENIVDSIYRRYRIGTPCRHFSYRISGYIDIVDVDVRRSGITSAGRCLYVRV